jgi:hypothetical protein
MAFSMVGIMGYMSQSFFRSYIAVRNAQPFSAFAMQSHPFFVLAMHKNCLSILKTA